MAFRAFTPRRRADAAPGAQSAEPNGPAEAMGDTSSVAGATGRPVAMLPLRSLVFVGGMVSMLLEMSASRLLAPYFGTSLFIWANLIGLVLIYLSAGYFLGGRLADRYPSMRLLSILTTIAALATGLIPFISEPILDWSVSGMTEVNASVFYSSLVAVILLFGVPITLLGMVSPFAVRLSARSVGSTGRSAGGLYALSTVGSIVGTFLPVLLLIPSIGVKRTIITGCVALLAASLYGLRFWERIPAAIPGAILLLPLFLPQVAPLGALKTTPGMIFSQESFYNYIQVVQTADGTRQLVLNEGEAIHSVYNPNQILTGWYWDYFLAMPYFNQGENADKVKRVAIIGLAAGTIARQFTAVYGPVPIDGVEIDPAIVDVGRRYFDMTEPNLHVHTADGRTFMRITHNTYDVVAIDAFQQPYIPFQLTTKEFFEEVRAHMSPTGVLELNTGHTRTDYRLAQAFINTLSQVFPSVYAFDVPDTFNTEIVATNSPTTLATFRDNLSRVSADSLLGRVAAEVLPVARVAKPEPGGIVFTDDQAPVEQLTDQLILNYIQQGG
ncbi:MAG TPA: fused MFS/spermidine synthase [Ktedonobacterales bacterium]|nr:fused MFS/spermidine synthase [Ktedonobacterales bacterium]